ncbi:hypothetical protein FGG08_003960 [Glutinoglossum americanum]|uniref:Uncharacterized protein n=1 Tax=Glutinoglossum americanum TaxID=1670608 RepID=A0A9P8I1J3_9PEZI|nr:hypothetical protein FGG08_003960 [Glutinoglossum americanum]
MAPAAPDRSSLNHPLTSVAAAGVVSWQSAFWTLVPLGLNSMTQPSGRVCGFDVRHRAFIRSSPIVCATDGVDVLAQMLCFVCLGDSPRTAARRVARGRLRDVKDVDCANNGFSGLEGNRVFRMLGFFFGALPQVVKLLGMEGIPWTKVWGFAFFVSFLILELVIVWVGRGWEEDASLKEPESPTFRRAEETLRAASNMYGIISVAMTVGVWYSATDAIIQKYMCDPNHATTLSGVIPQNRSATYTLCSTLVVILAYLASLGYVTISTSGVMKVVTTVTPKIFYFGSFVMSGRNAICHPAGFRSSRESFLFGSGLALVWAIAMGLTRGYPSPFLRPHIVRSMEPPEADSLVMYFLCENFLVALVYYCFRYEAGGTVKPAWTETFG